MLFCTDYRSEICFATTHNLSEEQVHLQ